MKVHFENLSPEIVVFSLVAAVLLCGTWSLIVKSLVKNILKKDINTKRVFITLTAILFVAFMVITLIDEPQEFNR